MSSNRVDYLIVGLGIAGVWISHQLKKRNKSFVVFDSEVENTSSKKAAGLYNPITGRKMVKTWRAEELFKNLEEDYRELEKVTGSKFLHSKTIYRPFLTVGDLNDWQGRQADEEYSPFIADVHVASLGIPGVMDRWGGIEIKKSGYVDIPSLITGYRKVLIAQGSYQAQEVSLEELSLENEIRYRGYEAGKIIFCQGAVIPKLWSQLRFRPVRGDLIDIACELPKDRIVNQGVFIIPKENFFTVGATYDHNILSYEPQKEGIENIISRLGRIFDADYRILAERAGVRPATHDRKPYIGFHPLNRNVGIFNGLGAKGVTLAPYFAKHFVDVLENKNELEKEINVERVY
ncbi:MAG: FAD-dependent oxidoreductase [Bacteroidota bacterium]